MSEAAAKYNPDSNPHAEIHPHGDELRLLSINEAREILKIRHETVKKLIEEGKIEVVMIGKRVKIPMSSLRKFIAENTIKISGEDQNEQNKTRRDYINNKIDFIIKTRRVK